MTLLSSRMIAITLTCFMSLLPLYESFQHSISLTNNFSRIRVSNDNVSAGQGTGSDGTKPRIPYYPLYAAEPGDSEISEEEAFERIKEQFKSMQETSDSSATHNSSSSADALVIEKEKMHKLLMGKPANSLKTYLKKSGLATKGRKPDLAQRLVDYYVNSKYADDEEPDLELNDVVEIAEEWIKEASSPALKSFASLNLSHAAGDALARASFLEPTIIQSAALPLLAKKRESLILHAETGQGKTLCYLLPITERLWEEYNGNQQPGNSFALILTPSRELAAQVAGVATVLSPPNSVRLITSPSNLVRETFEAREKSETDYGGRKDLVTGDTGCTKIIVGSAKSISTSLFGDKKVAAPPTSKPEAKMFLNNVKYLVLDEVDRLLDVKKTRGKVSKYYKKHEKPAASIVSSVARMTLGKVQVVAASATVGRSLRRELARILGVLPDECPSTIRGISTSSDEQSPTERAITVPATLKHFVMPCDASTTGNLLTSAAFLVKNLPQLDNRGRRILFVISNGCGIKMRDAIGALRHFGVKPDPLSLMDVMEAEGTDNLIEKYRCISGSAGLGEKSLSNLSFDQSKGYLLLSGEESVRGMHLDDLDTVVIVGRPKGPDEYVHIAGRAGRAGKEGKVISIIGYDQAAALPSWESMLGIQFEPIDEKEAKTII